MAHFGIRFEAQPFQKSVHNLWITYFKSTTHILAVPQFCMFNKNNKSLQYCNNYYLEQTFYFLVITEVAILPNFKPLLSETDFLRKRSFSSNYLFLRINKQKRVREQIVDNLRKRQTSQPENFWVSF